MRRFDRATRAIVTIVVGALLAGGSLAPVARAVTPDPSDVVLVFDFSASILKDVDEPEPNSRPPSMRSRLAWMKRRRT